MTTKQATAVSGRISVDDEIKNLPAFAHPTLVLTFIAGALHVVSSYLYVAGTVTSAPLTIAINAVLTFALFTPMHDAAHFSVASHRSKARYVNDLVGHFASLFFPVPFLAFRNLHLQHHKHTNDPVNDPDHWVSEGPWFLLPLRWATIELKYYSLYLSRIVSHPRDEATTVLLELAGLLGFIAYLCFVQGFAKEVMVTWVLPGRIALACLSYTFDYLPHRPHNTQLKDSPYDATSVTSLVGTWTWILTWPMLFQNYHNIHHLFPFLPFYRYASVWHKNKEELIKLGTKVNPIIS